MFKGIGNLASLMKSAQQMGGKMQEMQEQLKGPGDRQRGRRDGGDRGQRSGGGVAGQASTRRFFGAGDREMLEDLLPAAINQAQAKAKQLHRDRRCSR